MYKYLFTFYSFQSSTYIRRIRMSFYSMKDRDARDRTIAEYIALKKKIKKRNEDEHAGNLDRYRELEETYKPIVESHAQMTRDVVDQITTIRNNATNAGTANTRE